MKTQEQHNFSIPLDKYTAKIKRKDLRYVKYLNTETKKCISIINNTN